MSYMSNYLPHDILTDVYRPNMNAGSFESSLPQDMVHMRRLVLFKTGV